MKRFSPCFQYIGVAVWVGHGHTTVQVFARVFRPRAHLPGPPSPNDGCVFLFEKSESISLLHAHGKFRANVFFVPNSLLIIAGW